MPVFEGGLSAADLRFAIVVARFNELVTRLLLEGARESLRRHGAAESSVSVVWVPGSFEIPVVARKLAMSGAYDAVICLGAVIRGATAHFDHVAGQASAGIARAALDSGRPVIFGVLTTDTVEQAQDRAGGKAGNKGADAATAAVEMANLLRDLDRTGQ
jgi:6,7-dimethyl-8-ribityllumazine synthase